MSVIGVVKVAKKKFGKTTKNLRLRRFPWMVTYPENVKHFPKLRFIWGKFWVRVRVRVELISNWD